MAILLFTQVSRARNFKLNSPDNKTEVIVTVENGISIAANFQSQELFSIENIYLDVEGVDLVEAFRNIRDTKTNSVNQIIRPEIKEKYKEITDNYNELTVDFSSNYKFTLRAFNNGIAYRFITDFPTDITVNKENFDLHLAADSLFIGS